MKVLLTGTHFTPAQAVIEQFHTMNNVEIIYVGRKSTREGDKAASVESQVLPKMEVKFIPIISGRLQRSFTIYTIPSLLKIPIGFLQSFFVVLREKPDVVLSFGGYISVPVVISSWLLSIPVIIHEQTLVSGLANTISSWFADKVAISFPQNKAFDKSKTVLTGNPMRGEVVETNEKVVNNEIKEIVVLSRKERLPILLITGGNQGSHVINESVGQALDNLTKSACVVHQTGDSKFNDFEKLLATKVNLKFPERYLPVKWVEGAQMGYLFKNIDLAVCRASMNTLLELAFFGVPSLVIPIPYLYKDEQNINAKFFVKLGLVEVLPQKDLTAKNLLESILNMLGNLGELREKAKGAKEVVIPDAAKRLALETLLLAQEEDKGA